VLEGRDNQSYFDGLATSGTNMTGLDFGSSFEPAPKTSPFLHNIDSSLSEDIRMPPVSLYKIGDDEHHRMDLCRWEDEGGRAFDDYEPLGTSMEEQRNTMDERGQRLTSPHQPSPDQNRETTVPATFEEFWPHYLAAHSKVGTRAVHYAAPAAGLVFALGCIATGNPLLALATPAVIYLPIFCSHWFIEGNSPKTFGNPLWSIRAEARMVYLAATGKLRDELTKHKIQEP
jgi:hypothetical protein